MVLNQRNLDFLASTISAQTNLFTRYKTMPSLEMDRVLMYLTLIIGNAMLIKTNKTETTIVFDDRWSYGISSNHSEHKPIKRIDILFLQGIWNVNFLGFIFYT